MKITLKHLFAALAFMMVTVLAHAQAPQMFNYQGIARDSKGNPMSNQKLSLKLSVLPAADATTAEYEETQMVTTNEFGLYTLQIGNGQVVNGQMKSVKWETGNKYIKVAIDPNGGQNYVDAGTNQLLSVPYAIYADKAGMAANSGHDKTRTGAVNSNAAHVAGDVNYLTKFTALNTIGKSLIYDNGTRLGIGTTTPAAGTSLHMLTTTGNIEHIRMQNTNSTGFGKFIMYNDNASNYATFTKYGSAYPGGYPSIGSLFPYANMLAFGNNLGPFLLANNGNVGIGIVTGGTTKLYFNAQQSTGYLGLGSSFIPAANVHIGNTATGDTLRITNATTGHLATDGMEIRNSGNAGWIMNNENSNMSIGTNSANPNYVMITPTQLLYNANTAPTINDVIYLKPKSTGGSNWMTFQGTKSGSYSFINMIDSGSGNKGTIFGQPSALYSSSDSAGFIIYNPSTHNTVLGTYNAGGLVLNNSNGKIGNGIWFSPMTGNAQLNINTSYDTAGHFTSSSSNALIAGVLRSEYVGPNVANDHRGIVGRSRVAPFWGYGVQGDGGWIGVLGRSDTSGAAGVYGSALDGAGLYGFSSRGNGTYSLTYSTNGGNSAMLADAAGSSARGIRAIADSNQAGVFTAGNANFSSALTNGVLRGEYTGANVMDAVGVYGRSIPNPANFYGIGVKGEGGYYGVYGSSSATAGYKTGVYGVASNAGAGNFGVYGYASGATDNWAGYFSGSLYATTGTFGVKPFMIDHPLDPTNKILRHSSIESNDMMNLYNGNITTDANGYATVEMPDYFEALNENFKYQLTVIGTFAQAIIKEEIKNNKFIIQTNQPNVKVSWQVSGVRHDAVAKKYPVIIEEEKSAAQKGKYIEPEAFGQPREMGANYPEAHRKDAGTAAIQTDYKADHQKLVTERETLQNEMKRREALEQENAKNHKQQSMPKNTDKPVGSK